MPNNFPKVTKSTQTGEIGVNMVARIVTNELGWLFRRNHNEHDFGIDGYIDLVSDDQGVTGRSLAVQIKCGHSFLSHKDDFGYVYYGETKHLNYLVNNPCPVLIILCDPNEEICYWELFDAAKTEPIKNGWKLSIPDDQIFSKETKEKLEEIAGPATDHLDQIKSYWELNKVIGDHTGYLLYVVSKEEIETDRYEFVVSFFERIRLTRAFANETKVELN